MHQKKARGKQSQICIHKSWTILFLWRIIYAITVVFLSFHSKLHLVQLWHDLITSVNKGRDLFHLSVHNSASSAFCLWVTSKHPPILLFNWFEVDVHELKSIINAVIWWQEHGFLWESCFSLSSLQSNCRSILPVIQCDRIRSLQPSAISGGYTSKLVPQWTREYERY